MRYVISMLLFILTSFNYPSNEMKVISEFTPKPTIYSYPTIKPKPKFRVWKIPKDQSKWTPRDWLAKMLMSETIDSTQEETLYLMGVTAFNIAKFHNLSLVAAITSPGAYSGVGKNNYYGWKVEPTIVHKRIAHDLITNGFDKSLDSLYVFCACELSIVKQSTRNWFYSLPLHKRIREITFYNYPKF